MSASDIPYSQPTPRVGSARFTSSSPRVLGSPSAARGVDKSVTVEVYRPKHQHHFWHMIGGLVVLVLIIMTALAINAAIKASIQNANNKLSIFDRNTWPLYLYAIILIIITILIAWWVCASL